MASLELIIMHSEVLLVFIKLSERPCCRVNFSSDKMILFSGWSKNKHLELNSVVWQSAFRNFQWVCSITEHYGLVLDRNNQYDIESRI